MIRLLATLMLAVAPVGARAAADPGTAAVPDPGTAAVPDPGTTAVPDPVTAELLRAVEAHPEDPALLFALAAHLEARGEAEAALARYESFAARFAWRRPEVWLRMGALLQELGRHAEAVPVLQRAVVDEADPAAAHLRLGLSLRALGRHAEADAHLARAGALAPELQPEALLLRALSRIESGAEADAVAHLERAIELDPEGEAGRSARLLLRAGQRAERLPWFHAEIHGGYETDTNVTLDGALELPHGSRERSDARAVWGAGVTLRPVRERRVGLALGLRYDQAEQEEISVFDTRRELAFFSLRLSPADRLALRLDGLATRTRLDHRRYQRTRSVRPSLLFSWGERAGVSRAFVDLEQVSYPEDVPLDSLERDGWALGGGLEHYLPLPRPGAWLSLGGEFRRYDTDSGRDVLRFASPYDHDRHRATVRVLAPLWLGFRSEASFSWSREAYEHRNVLELLLAGKIPPSTRCDTVLDARFSLVRPLTRYADVELRVQQLDRSSNIDLYDYDRRIVGIHLRVHTP